MLRRTHHDLLFRASRLQQFYAACERVFNPALTGRAEGTMQPWRMKQDHLSPCYTTRWDDIPVVKAN